MSNIDDNVVPVLYARLALETSPLSELPSRWVPRTVRMPEADTGNPEWSWPRLESVDLLPWRPSYGNGSFISDARVQTSSRPRFLESVESPPSPFTRQPGTLMPHERRRRLADAAVELEATPTLRRGVNT